MKLSVTNLKRGDAFQEEVYMPVYKDEERKSWTYIFYFYDDYGSRKQKKKRGFKTKKEATDALRKLEVQVSVLR